MIANDPVFYVKEVDRRGERGTKERMKKGQEVTKR